MSPRTICLCFLCFLSCCIPPVGSQVCFARTWQVSADGSGDAPTIQAGIDSAAAGDTVLLADGTYVGQGNRNIDFRGKPIVVTSAGKSPELCVIDCHAEEEVYRGFVFMTGEQLETVLEGVTIRGGYAGISGFGGGIFCKGASPTIRNIVLEGNYAAGGAGLACDSASCPSIKDVTFSSNYAHGIGGGLLCQRGSSPTLENVSFSENDGGWLGRGGGIACSGGSAPSVVNAVFVGNRGDYGGGGVYCENSSPTLQTVRFEGNKSQGDSPGPANGGGVDCIASSPLISECVFIDNWAMMHGGGVACRDGSNPTLREVTFCANGAEYGSGIYCENSSPVLDRVLVAFGKVSEGAAYFYGACSPTITCCDIYGNAGGDWVGSIAGQEGTEGNFSADPRFCDVSSGDISLEQCSPCMPGNHPAGYDCGGQIGAVGTGCGCDENVEPTTWGTIKSLFR